MTTETQTERQLYPELDDGALREALEELRKADLELRNMRSREGTLGDTLATYDLLLAYARAIVAGGLQAQAHALKRVRGTAAWALPPAFANALWVVKDAEGEKWLLGVIKAQEYGLDLEDYEREHRDKLTAIAEIEAELAGRELRRKQAQLEAAHAECMAQIKVDTKTGGS